MDKKGQIMKIAIIPWDEEFQGNRMFDPDNRKLNRDHLMTPYIHMKKAFEEKGDIVNTVDMYDDLTQVDYFLFFEFFPEWILKLSDMHMENRMIYCNAEPEVVTSYHSVAGYQWLKQFFPYILTWNEEVIDNQRIFKRIIPYYFEKHPGNMAFKDRKLLTNISGNKSSDNPKELYSERRRIIKFFEKNYPEQFDLYGTGWTREEYSSYQGTPANKFDVYHNYRFALSLENTKNVKGYITEKIYDCLVAGVVPVYEGADNILDYVPQSCFVDYKQFGTIEELADFLSNMTEEEYAEYEKAIEDFLNTDIQKRLHGSVYAENIYYVMKNGKQQDFRLETKARGELRTRLIRERTSLRLRSYAKKLIGKRK